MVKRDSYRIVVYFSTARWLKSRSFRSIRSYVFSAMIRIFTLSRFAHVSVGAGDIVLDPAMQGDLFWPTLGFLETYPTLNEIYVVRCPKPPQIEKHRPLGPRSPWPIILRWLAFGLYPTNDCVQVVCDHLRLAGVDVPKRIVSPRQLRSFLQSQGHTYAETGRVRSASSQGGSG